MLTTLAQRIYNRYLAALKSGASGRRRHKRWLRKARNFLLKLGDPDVIAQIDGFKFKTPFSSNIILSHFEFPFYDTVLPRLAKTIRDARGSLVMVDVGANIGASTYLVSRAAPGRFLCVEANPRFQASLTHNLAQIPGSLARFAALTDQEKRASVRHNYADGNSNIEEVAGGGSLLEFVTLDKMLAEMPDYTAPNLIKIDTEGFELKVLRGARGTLTKHRPALFYEFFPAFLRREGGQPDELFDLLDCLGYQQFIFYDGGGYMLVKVESGQADQLHSLRRYGELHHSFFDVAAFHESDTGLSHRFLAAEAAFFERCLHP